MKAIVYTSNTGSTAYYAKLLGNELGIRVYSAKEAKKNLPISTEIIYLGWIMAGKIQGYRSAVTEYKVCAVCAVGMGQTGTQKKEIREKNWIPEKIPVFTLQGNFDVKKLHGIYRIMMKIMIKIAGKALADKIDKTPEEEDMLDMILHNGERVKAQNLQEVIRWYNSKDN